MILPKVSQHILGHDIAKSIPKYPRPWQSPTLWPLTKKIVKSSQKEQKQTKKKEQYKNNKTSRKIIFLFQKKTITQQI